MRCEPFDLRRGVAIVDEESPSSRIGPGAFDLLTPAASTIPDAYLRDLFRVLPYWPRDRFLELCARDWIATRARLDLAELDVEAGAITVPEPAITPAKQPITR